MYLSSARSQYWSVARQAAALLCKSVDTLSTAVVELLVRQKQLTLGFPGNEVTITAPLSPQQLSDLIFKVYSKEDIREVSLVQEVISFLGLFVKSQPHHFAGVIRLKMSYLLAALKSELATSELLTLEQASERLFHTSPSSIKRLLQRLLVIHDDIDEKCTTANFTEWRERGMPSFDPEHYRDLLVIFFSLFLL